jgi:hypothetical protein
VETLGRCFLLLEATFPAIVWRKAGTNMNVDRLIHSTLVIEVLNNFY